MFLAISAHFAVFLYIVVFVFLFRVRVTWLHCVFSFYVLFFAFKVYSLKKSSGAMVSHNKRNKNKKWMLHFGYLSVT